MPLRSEKLVPSAGFARAEGGRGREDEGAQRCICSAKQRGTNKLRLESQLRDRSRATAREGVVRGIRTKGAQFYCSIFVLTDSTICLEQGRCFLNVGVFSRPERPNSSCWDSSTPHRCSFPPLSNGDAFVRTKLPGGHQGKWEHHGSGAPKGRQIPRLQHWICCQNPRPWDSIARSRRPRSKGARAELTIGPAPVHYLSVGLRLCLWSALPKLYPPLRLCAAGPLQATSLAAVSAINIGGDQTPALQVLEHGLHDLWGGVQAGSQRTDLQCAARADLLDQLFQHRYNPSASARW